jgi:hypothetical protein
MAGTGKNPKPITNGAKMNPYDYHYAVEVAGQPAYTEKEKEQKSRADKLAREYEKTFPKLAERKTGGITPTTQTVDKLYRPSK